MQMYFKFQLYIKKEKKRLSKRKFYKNISETNTIFKHYKVFIFFIYESLNLYMKL